MPYRWHDQFPIATWETLPAASATNAGAVVFVSNYFGGFLATCRDIGSGVYAWRPLNSNTMLSLNNDSGITVGPINPVIETTISPIVVIPGGYIQVGDRFDFQFMMTRTNAVPGGAMVRVRAGINITPSVNPALIQAGVTGATNTTRHPFFVCSITSDVKRRHPGVYNSSGFSDSTGALSTQTLDSVSTSWNVALTAEPGGTSETMSIFSAHLIHIVGV